MTATEVILTLICSILWLLAIAGHLIIIKVLLTPNERVKLHLPPGRSTWLLLISMTVSDLLALIIALPFTSLFGIFDDWFFNVFICNLSSFVKVTSVTISSYSILGLMMISYEMVVKSHRPRTSPLKVALYVGCIWVLALVTASPMLTAHEIVKMKGVHRENLETFYELEESFNSSKAFAEFSNGTGVIVERNFCIPRGRINHIMNETIFLYLQFIVPLVFVVYLFIKVADTLNGKSAGNNNQNSVEVAQQPEASAVHLPNDVKFVRMILITAVTFHLLWGPTNFIERLFTDLGAFYYVITVLAESTFFIKPFLYFAVNTNFQNALRTIGIATTDVVDTDGHQVGFSKLDEETEQSAAGVY